MCRVNLCAIIECGRKTSSSSGSSRKHTERELRNARCDSWRRENGQPHQFRINRSLARLQFIRCASVHGMHSCLARARATRFPATAYYSIIIRMPWVHRYLPTYTCTQVYYILRTYACSWKLVSNCALCTSRTRIHHHIPHFIIAFHICCCCPLRPIF